MAEDGTAPPFAKGVNNGTGSQSIGRTISMTRRLYTRHELDIAYPQQETVTSRWDDVKSKCACSSSRLLQILLGYVPIVDVLRHYKWRSDIVTDFMAGISLSFLQLPQGLALGLLANLPPVYGLYTTFYPAILYTFFGTSRHTSIGTNAIIALLTAIAIQNQMDKLPAIGKTPPSLDATADPRLTTTPVTTEDTLSLFKDTQEELDFKLGVATSVAFLSGIYLAAAGLLKLGFITKYLSTSFVGGFTTATAFHIVTSQLAKLLHIKVRPYSGAGKMVKTILDVFQKVGDANPADVVISLISVPFLLLVTIFINERYKDKLKVPVPVQLILVTVSTIISHFARLESKFGIDVVGDIPLGLPSPSLPNPGAYPGIAYDSVIMAVLIFTISISLAKLTAKLHRYHIDDHQEFMAYGLTNTLSSFFGCCASCNAPPRAMILSAVGAKSTLNNIFCAIFILIALLWAGPLFYDLPVAVLAAMICTALKNILLQVTQLPFLWRSSKPDLVIWVLTFLTSVLADLEYGILVGVVVSFIVVVINGQLTSGSVGAVSAYEDAVLLDAKRRSGMKSSDNFTIFYFPSQLYFVNAENFKNDLFSKVLNPGQLANREIELEPEDKNVSNCNQQSRNGESLDNVSRLKHIILECSAMTYVDLDGARMLKDVAVSYRDVGVSVLLCNCPDYLLRVVDSVGYFQELPKDSVYFDVIDATSVV